MDAACGWRPPIEPGAPDNLADFIATIRAKPPHGGAFHYVSPNAVVLGWVLEAVSGERFADLLSRLIWQPMGAQFDADLAVDRRGKSQTEGGLNVTLRDLARFGELHRLGGCGIVPAAWIEDLRTAGDADAWDRGTMADMMPGHHYRSQWYTNLRHPHRPFFTAGAFGQSVFVDPVAELVIAKLSCFPGDKEDKLFDDMFRAFHGIAAALSDTTKGRRP
jgi:CubicO group peptidase (beta-lactamase class C family)